MSAPLTRSSYNKLVVILGTLTAFAPLSIDMYLPGLPAIAREFNVPTSAVQQTLAVFFIGLSLGQALYGPISDRVGRRRPLLFGCMLYVVASIGCALAPSIGSLIMLRLAQALGGCAGVVIARSVVRDLFDQKESARMFSFLMLVMGLAPILAPLIGGQVLAASGWRAIFVVLAGFGVLCVVLVLFGLQETLPVERRVQAGLGEALRVYGRLLTDVHFMGYVLASGLASACMFTYISGSPFVFIELNGVPPERYGLIFGMNAFGLILASQINRRLLNRYDGHQILRVALMVTASSALFLFITTALSIGGFALMLALIFICIGSTGFVGPNATAAAMANYGRQAGSASALIGAIQFALGAAAGALLSTLHNGTALPMAGVIALCGAASFVCLQVMANRVSTKPASAVS
jgi:DHA1 family bicyclomycin/chloramphenicol resistance-like MFS transporter